MNKDLWYCYIFNKITEFFIDITKYIKNGSMSLNRNTSKNIKFTNHWFSLVPTASLMANVQVYS